MQLGERGGEFAAGGFHRQLVAADFADLHCGKFHNFRSKVAINFGAMLDAIDADEGLSGIHPVKNPLVADAEFAEAG